MAQTMPFDEVLEAADRLSPDEQETLVGILRRRLTEAGRRRVADDIREAREEFAAGQCKAVSPEELMREIQA